MYDHDCSFRENPNFTSVIMDSSWSVVFSDTTDYNLQICVCVHQVIFERYPTIKLSFQSLFG